MFSPPLSINYFFSVDLTDYFPGILLNLLVQLNLSHSSPLPPALPHTTVYFLPAILLYAFVL